MERLENEYNMLTHRVDMIQDPIYAVDLQEKVDDLHKVVVEKKRDRKHLEDK